MSRRPHPLTLTLVRHRRGRRQGWQELYRPLSGEVTAGLPAPMRSLLEQFLAVPEVARVLADSALDMQDAEARADRRAGQGHPLATAELDRATAELRDFLEEAEQ